MFPRIVRGFAVFLSACFLGAILLAVSLTARSKFLYGDIDDNGKVNRADALLALRHSVQLVTLEGVQWEAADVNGDGRVDVADAILILRKIAGRLELFPLEERLTEAAEDDQESAYANYTVSWEGPLAFTYGSRGEFNVIITGDGAGETGCTAIFDYALTGGKGLLEYRKEGLWQPLPLAGTIGSPGLELPLQGEVTIALRFTPHEAARYNFHASLLPAKTEPGVIASMDEDFVVRRRLLTITANAGEKTYGEKYLFAGTEFTVDGLLRGDTVTRAALASAGAAADAAAGIYEISAANAVGIGLDNYEISYCGGKLTVVRAVPAVSAWPTAAPIYEGDPLSASLLLGGAASVPGIFAFGEPGLKPAEGLFYAAVTFMPDDMLNHSSVSGTVPVAVHPARALAVIGCAGYIIIETNYGPVLPQGSAAAVITGNDEWFKLGEHLEVRIAAPFPNKMSSLSLTPTDYGWVIVTGYGFGIVERTALTVEIRDRENTAVTGQFTVVVERAAWGVGYLTIGPITV